MGADKGQLMYKGVHRVNAVAGLLGEYCEQVVVSVTRDKASEPVYAAHHLVFDGVPGRGPAAGLLAAWKLDAGAAWLVVAVDMPFVDRGTLRLLVDARDTSKLATAFRHADGTVEPLCTIWEPAAREWVQRELDSGRGSLRIVLETADIRVVDPVDASRLESVDTPERYAALEKKNRARPKSGDGVE